MARLPEPTWILLSDLRALAITQLDADRADIERRLLSAFQDGEIKTRPAPLPPAPDMLKDQDRTGAQLNVGHLWAFFRKGRRHRLRRGVLVGARSSRRCRRRFGRKAIKSRGLLSARSAGPLYRRVVRV